MTTPARHPFSTQSVSEIIVKLSAWLESMHHLDGYSGPAAHWWRDSLDYTGPGLDWRYEGIISGYLNLFQQTGSKAWLDKAKRAGMDLVQGQLPGGSYRHSGFEINPQAGGTPHEAACDLGLLRLASVLQRLGQIEWQIYADTAVRNLEQFVLGLLWREDQKQLRNTAYDDSFVPNKAATTVEALFAWAELDRDEKIITHYCLPILEAIITLQIRDEDSLVNGAIPQATANDRYFPYYIARCIPALVQGYRVTNEYRYLAAAQAAMRFILRYQQSDGAFPQVVYRGGRYVNQYPQWIAAVGDILRAMALLEPWGESSPMELSLNWLLQGQQTNGSIRTARGFAGMINQRAPGTLPDFRDVLGVCGWSDKAFHYLTSRSEAAQAVVQDRPLPHLSMPCRYRGKPAILREDETQIEVRQGQLTLYRWRKGMAWAEVCAV
jgi:hypothetical protein